MDGKVRLVFQFMIFLNMSSAVPAFISYGNNTLTRIRQPLSGSAILLNTIYIGVQTDVLIRSRFVEPGFGAIPVEHAWNLEIRDQIT